MLTNPCPQIHWWSICVWVNPWRKWILKIGWLCLPLWLNAPSFPTSHCPTKPQPWLNPTLHLLGFHTHTAGRAILWIHAHKPSWALQGCRVLPAMLPALLLSSSLSADNMASFMEKMGTVRTSASLWHLPSYQQIGLLFPAFPQSTLHVPKSITIDQFSCLLKNINNFYFLQFLPCSSLLDFSHQHKNTT